MTRIARGQRACSRCTTAGSASLRLGPEAGEVVAFCRPGWRFSDPDPVTSNPIPGNHGHPATRPIPFFISGGHPSLPRLRRLALRRADRRRRADRGEVPRCPRRPARRLRRHGPRLRRSDVGGPRLACAHVSPPRPPARRRRARLGRRRRDRPADGVLRPERERRARRRPRPDLASRAERAAVSAVDRGARDRPRRPARRADDGAARGGQHPQRPHRRRPRGRRRAARAPDRRRRRATAHRSTTAWCPSSARLRRRPLRALRGPSRRARPRRPRAYVGTALQTLSQRPRRLHRRPATASRRPDGTRGGNAQIDVYLGELGDQGVYGYCTSDEPETSANTRTYDRWAYCALDNDYARVPDQHPAREPPGHRRPRVLPRHPVRLRPLRGQLAPRGHRRLGRGRGLRRASTTTCQYLRRSPLDPAPRPARHLRRDSGFHYGTWSFFRFLTERFPAQRGGLPRLVLDIFKRVDGARGGPDQYSWQAVDTRPARQGHLRGGRCSAPTPSPTAGPSGPTTRAARAATRPRRCSPTGASPPTRGASGSVRLDHLTSATVRLRPEGLRVPGGSCAWVSTWPRPCAARSALLTTATTARARSARGWCGSARRATRCCTVPFASAPCRLGRGHPGQRQRPVPLLHPRLVLVPGQLARRRRADALRRRSGALRRRAQTPAGRRRPAGPAPCARPAGSVVVHIGGRLALRKLP